MLWYIPVHCYVLIFNLFLRNCKAKSFILCYQVLSTCTLAFSFCRFMMVVRNNVLEYIITLVVAKNKVRLKKCLNKFQIWHVFVIKMVKMKYNRIDIKWRHVSTSFKIYLEMLSNLYITFTIFYYNTNSQTIFIILFSSFWTVDREKN
jgi:hypothetical protein